MSREDSAQNRDRTYAILGGIGMLTFAVLWEIRWQRLIRAFSQRDRSVEQWTERALHDPLTSMPNRTLLADRIEQALIRAQRQGTGVALLFIDLDDFKVVNDTYGHLVGDRLLIAAGERFRQHLRASDTAARLGGDEFVVLLETRSPDDPVELVAERLRRALHVPLLLDPEPISLNASIGVIVSSSGTDSPDDMLDQADRALIKAKQSGKDQIVIGPVDEPSVEFERRATV